MSDRLATAAACVEFALALFGCSLLWRHAIRPAREKRLTPARLPVWEGSPSELVVFLLYVVGGTFLFGVTAGFLARPFGFRGDAATVFSTAALHFGMLVGALSYYAGDTKSRVSVADGRSIIASGFATFLMTLPLLLLSGKLWEMLLQWVGLPTEKQDVIDMLMRAESGWLVTSMIVLATIVAPITEELVFRAGLFRFFRTRLPRPVAFVLPGVLFAALHVNWDTYTGLASFAPLVVLAVLFSAAYERTGHIATPMIAHALFNLNMVALIFAGVNA